MLYKTIVLAVMGLASASYTPIGGYVPMSRVTDHAAIDRDQQAIEELADAQKFTDAQKIYERGGNSRSQVVFTIPAQPFDIPSGKTVTGTSMDGGIAEGATRSVDAGGTSLTMRYTTYDSQASYVKCVYGAMSEVTFAAGDRALTFLQPDKCFKLGSPPSPITIKFNDSYSVQITPSNLSHTAGRTIQGFNLRPGDQNGAWSYYKYSGCPQCPYAEMLRFVEYYGGVNYANDMVMAALLGNTYESKSKRFTLDYNSVTNPSTGTPKARVQGVKKGTDFLNVFMYVIREYEDAIADCIGGNLGDNDGAAHAWDEGVAFYAGSLEGEAGTRSKGLSSKGVMLYDLADYRCQNFKTCGPNFDSTTGTSQANYKIMEAAASGQHYLLMGECEKVRKPLDKIVDQMRVPMIQGALRYAYRTEGQQGHNPSNTYQSCGSSLDKCQAEGAVFAAAVLPALHSCSASAAKIVADNLRLKEPMPAVDFPAVKRAFESNYACLNITCKDIGGLYENNEYFKGAEPCVDPVPAGAQPLSDSSDDDLPAWALVVIIVVGALFLILFFFTCWVIKSEKAGKPIFTNLDDKKTRPGATA
jgi:hypothetical protein